MPDHESVTGERALDPAQTTHERRAVHVIHEMTAQPQRGPNALGLMLGNRFYGQLIALAPPLSSGPPRGRLVLEITYNGGSRLRVEREGAWKARIGPVLFDSIYLGETSITPVGGDPTGAGPVSVTRMGTASRS